MEEILRLEAEGKHRKVDAILRLAAPVRHFNFSGDRIDVEYFGKRKNEPVDIRHGLTWGYMPSDHIEMRDDDASILAHELGHRQQHQSSGFEENFGPLFRQRLETRQDFEEILGIELNADQSSFHADPFGFFLHRARNLIFLLTNLSSTDEVLKSKWVRRIFQFYSKVEATGLKRWAWADDEIRVADIIEHFIASGYQITGGLRGITGVKPEQQSRLQREFSHGFAQI